MNLEAMVFGVIDALTVIACYKILSAVWGDWGIFPLVLLIVVFVVYTFGVATWHCLFRDGRHDDWKS